MNEIVQSLTRNPKCFRRRSNGEPKRLKTVLANGRTWMGRVFHGQTTIPRSRNPFDLDVAGLLLDLREIIFHLHAEPYFRA